MLIFLDYFTKSGEHKYFEYVSEKKCETVEEILKRMPLKEVEQIGRIVSGNNLEPYPVVSPYPYLNKGELNGR